MTRSGYDEKNEITLLDDLRKSPRIMSGVPEQLCYSHKMRKLTQKNTWGERFFFLLLCTSTAHIFCVSCLFVTSSTVKYVTCSISPEQDQPSGPT